jgi:hypothetical protein
MFLVFFYIFLGFAYLYIFSFIKSVYLGRKRDEFRCLRCGKCCKLNTKVSESDAKRIGKLGYKNFLNGSSLKRRGGNCMFLEEKNGFYTCRIYRSRPDVCRNWPFYKTFFGKLTLAKTFSCPGLARISRLKHL